MAKNLRAKIPEGDTLSIFDVNKETVERFVKEVEPAKVTVAKAPRDVVEHAVRCTPFPHFLLPDEPNCSIYDLSWGLRPFLMIPPTLKPIL